jgi:hypothetical protein
MRANRASIAILSVVAAIVVAWLAWLRWPGRPRADREPLTRRELSRDLADSIETSDELEIARQPLEPDTAHSPVRVIDLATEPEPPAITALHLFGRVLDDSSDRPLKGAAIDFIARRKSSPALVAHGVSGDDGSFDVTAIEDDKLAPPDPKAADALVPVMTIRLDGFAPSHWPPWKRGLVENNLATAQPYSCGDIRLTRGAIFTGRVVADADGRGIAGATLLISEDERPYRGATFDPYPIGRTDERGTMIVDDDRVPSLHGQATWLLLAVSPRGIGWTRVAVLAGRERVADVEVRVFDPLSVTVDVVDADDQPIEGAVVRAEPRFDPLDHVIPESYFFERRPCEPLTSLLSATTDDGGHARFAALPLPVANSPSDRLPTRYNFVAERDGYVRAWFATKDKDYVVIRRKGPEHPIRIVMPRFRACTIAGRVIDIEQHGIPSARITLNEKRSFACDKEGRFEIQGVDPSQRRIGVVASAPGFVRSDKNIELSAQSDPAPLEFALERPMPIEGRVVDETHALWKGAIVWADRERRSAGWVRTSADGRFLFENTTAGEWRLRCDPPEERNFGRFESVRTANAGDRNVELVLPRPRGAKVVAEIVDAASGERLDPTDADLVGGPDARWKRWEVERASGVVTADGVRAGKWCLWAEVAGRGTGFTEFEVRDGDGNVAVEVKIGGTAGIALLISYEGANLAETCDLSGNLVAGDGILPIWLVNSDRCRLYRSRNTPDGVRHFDNVIPGQWKIDLVGPGVRSEKIVDVPPGQETFVPIVAKPAAVLHFLSDVGDESILVFVEVVRSDGVMEPRFSPPRPKFGRFEDEVPVREGSYSWTAKFRSRNDSSREIAEPQSGELVVAAGERRRVEIPFVAK